MELTLEQAFELDVEELSVGTFDVAKQPTYLKVKKYYGDVQHELYTLEDCLERIERFKDYYNRGHGINLSSELDEIHQSLEDLPKDVQVFILEHKKIRFYPLADYLVVIKAADVKSVAVGKKDHLGRIKGILTIEDD